MIFHRYSHTEEKWSEGFEIGAGHKVQSNIEITSFQNGDTLLHRINDDVYFFHYDDWDGLVRCSFLVRIPVTVVNLPYFSQ